MTDQEPSEVLKGITPLTGHEKDLERRRILAEGIDLGVAPHELGWDRDENPPWWPTPGEPDRWYGRFERFFLMQGPSRSLQAAYRMWVASDNRELGLKGKRDIANNWKINCLAFRWRERAAAYDGYINHLIMKKVEASRRRLQDAAPLAVDALVNALTDTRSRVPAAKEILDRAGLPSTTRQEIRAAVGFTSEDLSEASAEVDEWEKKMLSENG